MKRLLVLLVGILAACASPRPDGFYTPKEPDSGSLNPDNFEGTGETDEADQSDDSDGVTAKPDSATTKPKDAGQVGKPVQDAGAPAVDPKSPYAKLAGHYLMRMDMYSTADATKGSDRLWVDNRVSNLMSVTLSAVDGKLMSTEKLCDQTYLHTCRKGCGTWTTKLDKALSKSFFPNAIVKREYKIVDNTLTAVEATLPLGFDSTDPTPATALPTSPDDSRVWKLSGPSNPEPHRVGVLTQLRSDLKSSALSANFVCNVATVQSLITSFTIKVDDLSNPFALAGKFYELDASKSKADPIWVEKGDGISPLSQVQSLCTLETFKGQGSMNEFNVVSFKRMDDLEGCPTGDWEDVFPGSPGPPTLK